MDHHLDQLGAVVVDVRNVCWWRVLLLRKIGLNLRCCCQPGDFYYTLLAEIYAVDDCDNATVVDYNTFVVKNLVDLVVYYDVVDYDNVVEVGGVVDLIGEQLMLLTNQILMMVVHTSAGFQNRGQNLFHGDSYKMEIFRFVFCFQAKFL